MQRTASFVLAAVALVGCLTADPTDDDSDPDLDGKADSAASATSKGALVWGDQDTAFGSATLVYYTFELSGAADVTFETAKADTDLDTVLYLYQPTGDRWGAYLAKNDDGGDAKFSTLVRRLDAGAYRVLVKRKSTTGAPHTKLSATCSGDGCAAPPRGCTPLAPRTSTPELFVGPDQWQTRIEAAIDSAVTSLDVQMYLFTVSDIADHIIAAQQRGVALRVLLDGSEASNNARVKAKLDAAGVANHLDPSVFSFAHAKYMILDGNRGVILSGNFNAGATNTTGGGERNYGFIDRDADDVADLQAIYESDWTGGAEPDLSCTRLLVSPINSQQRVIDHVMTAQHTLDIEVLYLDHPDVRAAIVDRAQHGVAVRILLSDPSKNPQNTATEAYFKGENIPTKLLITNYLHTKMIEADGVAMVGSENMSITSLTKNREVGALLAETAPAATVHAQYELDWAAGE
jgi:phosphatidylserine/phosphatidylglycerophosphate/cardiolipin synthase-like enzyme